MDSDGHQAASKQCTFTLLHSASLCFTLLHSASLCLVRFLQSSKPISLPDESIRLSKTHLVSPLAARNYISQNVSEARSAKLLNTWVIKCPHVSHHPTIRYMIWSIMATILGDVQYSQVMGHLPTPVNIWILSTLVQKKPVSLSEFH